MLLAGSQELRYTHFESGRWEEKQGPVIREGPVRLHVNGREFVSLMCTPRELDWLALGFLRSEGIINGLADVRLVKVCPSETCVDIWLRRVDVELPSRITITSGCGGGVTFTDLSSAAVPVTAEVRASPRQICALIAALQESAGLYRQARGVHTAALARGDRLLAVVEDVGRHNTLDKLWGRCMAEDIATEGGILLSTGRISSEMLYKAARMGIPLVASRTSPTSLSVALAATWNLTLVGYVRRDSLNVYTGAQRLAADEGERNYAHA
jgi:FdhD protein